MQLPLYRALRKEILLADEIAKEEVAIQIRYEKTAEFLPFLWIHRAYGSKM